MVEIPLIGGRANAGSVMRIGDEVARPSHPQTPFVEHFLRFLGRNGFSIAPEPLGHDAEGRQRLSYIEGSAPTSPYRDWAYDPDLLIDVALQQRKLQQVALGYVPPSAATWAVSAGDYFPDGSQGTLFCHNDLSMSNVIVDVEHRLVAGFIDFDYVAPTNRLFDIAVLARHWAPFGDPDGAEIGELNRVARFRSICDVHELDRADRDRVVELAINFLDRARHNVRRLADSGNVGFQQMIEAGYESTNLSTSRWVSENRRAMVNS